MDLTNKINIIADTTSEVPEEATTPTILSSTTEETQEIGSVLLRIAISFSIWNINWFTNIYSLQIAQNVFIDIEEPTSEKIVSYGEEFEYVFTTDGPGGFVSCDVHRPGAEWKDDPLYIQTIGSDKNVTR